MSFVPVKLPYQPSIAAGAWQNVPQCMVIQQKAHGRPQNQHDLSQCCLFRPPEPNGRLGRSPCLLRRAANGVDDRGRERCPRPIGCCAFGRRLSAVMSGAGASDIPDAAGSVTCLVLSQASHSPAFEQCQWSRDTGKVPNQSSIRFWYSCRQNSPSCCAVSRLRFTTSAHRMAGQPVDPRLVFLSVKKSLPLGHGCDRLAYPEVALLKIVSK